MAACRSLLSISNMFSSLPKSEILTSPCSKEEFQEKKSVSIPQSTRESITII
jgi:hypothetical protein